MRSLRTLVALLAVAFCFSSSLSSSLHAQTLQELVERMSEHVATVVNQLSSLVAEERYIQDLMPSVGMAQHRELRADFLLVKPEGTSNVTAFRDVFEVSGRPVRDRDERLTKLFLQSSSNALSQATAITTESARYNIGTPRTVNNPLVAVALLQPIYRTHFAYSLQGTDKFDGAEFTVVHYTETQRPTIIRGRSNGDIVAEGRYWVDPRTGNIVKSELQLKDGAQTGKVTTTFGYDERLESFVPLSMEEEYFRPSVSRLTAAAKYTRFRRFEVKTEESLKNDPATK